MNLCGVLSVANLLFLFGIDKTESMVCMKYRDVSHKYKFLHLHFSFFPSKYLSGLAKCRTNMFLYILSLLSHFYMIVS